MEDIKVIFSGFESTLDQMIRQSWPEGDPRAGLEWLVAGAEAVGGAMIKVGDAFAERPGSGLTSNIPYYVIHFLWAGRAKAFLILWRDMVFELQKANLLLITGRLAVEQYADLQKQSAKVLSAAGEELKAFPQKEIQSAILGRGKTVHQIKRWKLMADPWPIYKEQIAFLSAQCRCLLDEHLLLHKVHGAFSAIRTLIEQTTGSCEEETGELETLANQTIRFIEEHVEAVGGPKPGKMAVRLETLEGTLQWPDYQANFSAAFQEQLTVLPDKKTQVSVQIHQGMMQYREFNFRRSARLWLESEILPLLYEIWELTEEVRQSLHMSLVNIRNRVLLLATEGKEKRPAEVEKADLCQPLYAFMKKMSDFRSNLKDLHFLVDNRLEMEFALPFVYDLSRDFLPVPLQSTINQLGLSRNLVLYWVQRGVGEVTSRLQQLKTNVEEEESLGISEKIVRFIRARTFPPENHHYTSIFITRGYIGESFWVGRQRELAHVANLIENWRLGFRGAVILSGQRFSGKSLFGELVASRHFPGNVIRLAPNTAVKIQGRHLKVGWDLEEALEFIRKYSLNSRPLVWIDDLELWRDPEHPLGQNIRTLCKMVDSYATRIFFIVSMSNWFKAHLHKFQDIERVFQTQINLDHMSVDDIREAILIRHGATHKVLIDDKGREVTPQQFRKMTNRISKVADGNIGEALNWWSFSTRKVNDEQVCHIFKAGYPLPDFLNPDVSLILSAVTLAKRTNEYRLRKLFGGAFTEKYGVVVQRLIGLGILTRHPDGWLEVSDLVANYVAKMLEKKKYLPV